MPATVIVGAQWGDEGKGKIVDLLAQESDLVCRYQGGPNAGHTVIVGEEVFKFRQIPSGLVSGKVSVLGNGCVVDPEVLLAEIDDLEERGLSVEPLRISGNAHLIMPWHIAIDGASEKRLGKLQIGTTRRGIGPAYADKAARLGIRVQDLLDAEDPAPEDRGCVGGEERLAAAGLRAGTVRARGRGLAVRGLREAAAPVRRGHLAARLRGACGGEARAAGGAQGTLLDLDHGTYPFVTSSNPVAGAAATGIGIGPTRIDEVIGVAKAYVTRVGAGPFPSEMDDTVAARVRELGQEYGTVTGRGRRPGWLDLVGLRYAVRLNGITSLALTKLDVLSVFDELQVCVRYRLPDGTETPDFPAHQSDFHHAQPVMQTVPGWGEPLDDCTSLDDLPDAARAYVELVERALDVPVRLVGTGAERDQVLAPAGA